MKRHEHNSDDITQPSHLHRFTIAVNTLAQHQRRPLPGQTLSEIFLTYWIVDLVLHMLIVYTFKCLGLQSNDLQLDYRPLKTVEVHSEYTETY